MRILNVNLLGFLKPKPAPVITVTPAQELKTQIESINLHPTIGIYARHSESLKAAYRSAQNGYLTTYASALAKSFAGADDIYEMAISIMSKAGELNKNDYFKLLNSLNDYSPRAYAASVH